MFRFVARTLGSLVLVAVAGIVAPGVGSAAFVPIPPSPVPGIAVDGTVRAVVVGDGVAFVGGDFSSARGANGTFSRSRVAAFNVKTGEVLPFRADASATVRALVLRGGSLFVGGDFTTIGGQSRSRLAEVSADSGAVVTDFRVNTTGAVRALAAGGDRLYVGGNFGQIAGVAQPRVAAVDIPTRRLVTTFRPTVDATVAAVATTKSGDKAYFGGGFLNFNGAGRRYLAGVDSSGANLPVAFSMSTGYGVQAIDLNDDGSRVFAAIGGSGNQAASFSATTGTKLWRQRAMGDVQAIAYEAGNVYFGFHEGFENDLTLRLLAADSETGALEAFRPPINSFYGVRALDATAKGVLAGGEFTTVNGVDAGRAAFFDADLGPKPPQTRTVIPADSVWRYFDGASVAGGWNATSFDDSGWSAGGAELGYGDGDEATVLGYGPSASQKYVTSYFRRSFEWNGAFPVARVRAALLADDGAVLYVNGVEVARDNMPSGPISATTLAASNRSGSAETVAREFTVPAELITPGTNVVAVEVHQDARSSSDLSFKLALTLGDS